MKSACGLLEVPNSDARMAVDAVSQHLGLVHHIARTLTRGRARNVEHDELVSAGTLGLIAALANFDATRGLAFTTFAAPRIRGAMLDELRRLDHVPRSVRRRARAVASATDTLTGELGSAPNAQQVAERLGVDCNTLDRWRSDNETARRLSLTVQPEGECDDACVESGVDDAITREQEVAALRDALLALSSRERSVLTLYFYEELRLHQIAEVLGVTESRVSQIRTQAIARLRDKLGRLRDPGVLRDAVATPPRRSPSGALRSA